MVLVLGLLLVVSVSCVVIGIRSISKDRSPELPTDLRRVDDDERGTDTRAPGQAVSDAVNEFWPLS
jgi:hypothetical protein